MLEDSVLYGNIINSNRFYSLGFLTPNPIVVFAGSTNFSVKVANNDERLSLGYFGYRKFKLFEEILNILIFC